MSKPFHPIRKVKGGDVVIARSTGKPLEKHPIPKARAEAQLRAVEMHKHEHTMAEDLSHHLHGDAAHEHGLLHLKATGGKMHNCANYDDGDGDGDEDNDLYYR
jgi:hypothetical protein